MKTSRIYWYVNAFVKCPHCGNDSDFMEEDDWWEVCEIGETKELSRPYEMECHACKEPFHITRSDY